jgi:hypothetical protein
MLYAAGMLAGTAHAQPAPTRQTVFEMALPVGLRDAQDAVQDRVAPDRAQFLLEFIRRTYDSPVRLKQDPRTGTLETLLQRLRESRQPGAAAGFETLPLPLAPGIWTEQVFGGRIAAGDLLSSILRSRGASLLYAALLSLDDETRAWIGGEPTLIAEIVKRAPARFLVAAPALRVTGGAVSLPGGPEAVAGWEALTGRRVTAPADFVRALLAERDGRLAYFAGAISLLTPEQIRFALSLDSSDREARIAAMRRLANVFDHVALNWDIEDHAFRRPTMDPALLTADLKTNADGRPVLPGSRSFWQAAFAGSEPSRQPAATLANGALADFGWLCEQVFDGGPMDLRGRYYQVLFASRVLPQVTSVNAVDALDAVRSMDAYPALTAELERAGVREPWVYAAAARRAARIDAIGDRERAARSIAQFQSVLALVSRGVRRGSLSRDALPELVSSLALVEVSAEGDYEARLVRWVQQRLGAIRLPDDNVSDAPVDGIDRTLLLVASGATPRNSGVVDWEGTRYRVDVARAEALRMMRILGDNPRPFVSPALGLADQADALERKAPAARNGREIARLRVAADVQLARGLLELVYAVALGEPERTAISAADAAARHDFGFESRQAGPWRLAFADSDADRGWHATGSLLGLDVALADRALTRVSSGPLRRAPTMTGPDRRAFVEAVALVEPSLTDPERDAIAVAIRKGRERVAAARTAADVGRLAADVRLSPERRTLLPWTLAHEPERIASFFSPVELFWLGGGQAESLQAWGAPASPRLGCLCLQLSEPRPWELVAGRWHSGLLASSFPDLNLRLAELLAELRMPASLLHSVLASATLDLSESAQSRDGDDRRALVDFVQTLSREHVEEYLALLTTGGPLVPVGDAR